MDVRKVATLWFKCFKLGLLVVSPCFLLVAIGSAISTAIFMRQSVAVEGVVFDLATVHSDQDTTLTYAPIFTYTAADGTSYKITSNSASNPPGFTIGDRVRVLYELRHPSVAKIDTFWQLWALTAASGIASVVTCGLGLLLLRAGRWRRRRAMAVAV